MVAEASIVNRVAANDEMWRLFPLLTSLLMVVVSRQPTEIWDFKTFYSSFYVFFFFYFYLLLFWELGVGRLDMVVGKRQIVESLLGFDTKSI